MKRLQGKTCTITGAAQGIGKAITQAFLQEGAKVIMTDKNIERGQTVANTFDCNFEKLDVSIEYDWQEFSKKYPEIDVLINNAGITGFEDEFVAHDPENVSLQDWQKVHSVNLDGTFLGCRYAIKAMRKARKGSILNISSRSAMVGIPAAAAYASSKAAIRNHTKTVALWCAQQGLKIRCNSIHPGAILTPMWEPILGQGEERQNNIQNFVKHTPLKRFGTASEVALMAIYLASDESEYVTGAEFTIDGGIMAGSIATP